MQASSVNNDNIYQPKKSHKKTFLHTFKYPITHKIQVNWTIDKEELKRDNND